MWTLLTLEELQGPIEIIHGVGYPGIIRGQQYDGIMTTMTDIIVIMFD